MAAGFRRKWPNLTWSRAQGADKTYRARSGDRSYAVDHDGRTWRLRGWRDGTYCLYKTAGNARELQKIADDIAGGAA